MIELGIQLVSTSSTQVGATCTKNTKADVLGTLLGVFSGTFKQNATSPERNRLWFT